MKKSEKDLDKALAVALEGNTELLAWVVSHTKFKGRKLGFESCRSNHPWGGHPFVAENLETGVKEETRRESETDVLLILRDGENRLVALHIENKLGFGAFTELQPEMYEQRARHWIDNPKYGNYRDFDTVLLAPEAFRDRNVEQVRHFGCFISHEQMARYVPEFGSV